METLVSQRSSLVSSEQWRVHVEQRCSPCLMKNLRWILFMGTRACRRKFLRLPSTISHSSAESWPNEPGKGLPNLGRAAESPPDPAFQQGLVLTGLGRAQGSKDGFQPAATCVEVLARENFWNKGQNETSPRMFGVG